MKCDGCTLCCELLNIPWMDSPGGELCKHCNDNGCGIFDTAPKDCLDYQCAYFQMDKASINLRPDKCGVIFEKLSNKLFVGTVDPNSNGFSDSLKGQINSFLTEGFSLVLFNRKIEKPIIFNTKDRTKESVWFEYKIVENDRREKREEKAKVNG